MCLTVSREFDSGVFSPSAARHFGSAAVIAHLLPSGWPVADDVETVISEFVTEAVNAGARRVELIMGLHRDHLDVRVIDDAGGRPSPATDADRETAERRARMVEALSIARGRDADDDRTTSWAQLRCEPAATAGLHCELAAAQEN